MGDPDTIHAVGCSDTNYSSVALRPFFKALRNAHLGEDLRLHYLTVNGTEEFRREIMDYCASIGLSIAIYEVGDKVVRAFAREGDTHARLTLAAYGRLFAGEVLPHGIGRVVYMDCDTICMGSLRELLAETDEGETVGMAVNLPDYYSAGRRDYFNSGVLVIPVAAWRRNGTAARLAELFLVMTRDGRSLRFYDQDLLNTYFAGQIREIPLAWNAQAFVNGAGRCVPADIWGRPDLRKPKLIHYAGGIKPWASPTTWMAFPRPAALAYARALVACAHASACRRWLEMTGYRLLSLGSLELKQGSLRLRAAHRFAEVVSGRESPFVIFRWLGGAISRRIR